MTIRKPPVMKPQYKRDFRKPDPVVVTDEIVKSRLLSREDFMLYLGRLDPKALLDGIDNIGGDDGE